MTVAFVVHVVAETAEEGRLAGRVEVVRTGEQLLWRHGDELLEIIWDQARRERERAAPPRT